MYQILKAEKLADKINLMEVSCALMRTGGVCDCQDR